MNALRSLARIAALLAIATASAAATDDPCSKNHYILDEPCAPGWTPASDGLPTLDVRVVARDPADPLRLFAGLFGGLYGTTDGGRTWKATGLLLDPFVMTLGGSRNPETVMASSVSQIAIDPRDSRVMYVGTKGEGGAIFWQRRLFKSVDGGTTWTDRLSPPINGVDNIHAIALDPQDPAALYIADFDDVIGDTWAPVMRSRDGAVTWEPLDYQVLNTLVVDPVDRLTLYGGTDALVWYDEHAAKGVLVSRDGGMSWVPTEVANVGVSALALDDARQTTIYAATYVKGATWGERIFKGIYKSVDRGGAWSRADGGLEDLLDTAGSITSIVPLAGEPGVVYLASANAGVWGSADGGATWTSMNSGLPSLEVRSLAVVPGNPATLYAGTPAGVFRLEAAR